LEKPVGFMGVNEKSPLLLLLLDAESLQFALDG
jgi:hypothetical protein